MRVPAALLSVALANTAAAYRTWHRDDLPHDDGLHSFYRRNIVTSISDSYDYIIVGGGTAGLVLANRLSADSNTTVLVLEAGDTGYAVQSQIDIPSATYYDSLTGTSYDWAYETVAQPDVGDRTFAWPRGKLLGGSSAINGMYLVRPNELEVDTWGSLVENGSIWNWDNLFDAMKKSEDYTPPSAAVEDVVSIVYTNSSHGFDGPLHASYPGYMLPAVGNWTETLNAVGVPTSADPDAGDGSGAFIATSAINPSNWTRSYSRSAYIDPLAPRSNLAILVNATVTKINFANSSSGGLAAESVEYASAAGDSTSSVSVNSEVILAAGAVGSPQVLMVSGVGPKDVLEAADVDVVLELPGVGQHLQDHVYAEVQWSTTEQTGATMYYANYSDDPPTTSDAFLSFINSATAYVNFSALIDEPTTYQQEIAANASTATAALCPSQYSEVCAGYEVIYNVTAQKLLLSSVGHVEILLSLTGAGSDDQQIIGIQAALQHPLSQGRLYINSSSVFDKPVIDPLYFSNANDLTLLREGIKLCRTIGETAPLSAAMGTEVAPGSTVQTDDEWEAWLLENIYTEYHPSCSCAMLPESQGGVVGADLKVYGIDNVRVADSSVFPFEFSAHLQAPVYGLAEQAASIIRGTFTNGTSTSTSTSTSSTSSASASASAASDTSAALSAHRPAWLASGVAAAFVAVGASLVL